MSQVANPGYGFCRSRKQFTPIDLIKNWIFKALESISQTKM
jgi:hypothetical protein